jgi:hypothetical protein
MESERADAFATSACAIAASALENFPIGIADTMRRTATNHWR